MFPCEILCMCISWCADYKMLGNIFLTYVELRPRGDVKSQMKCLDSNCTKHCKIFFYIAALAIKQHIETGASEASDIYERNISIFPTMHCCFLYVRAICTAYCKQKDGIQLLHSLLLIFNLVNEILSPRVIAFRLVDSLSACLYHKFLVYSVVVEFLPLIYLFSPELHHALKYTCSQSKSHTDQENTST